MKILLRHYFCCWLLLSAIPAFTEPLNLCRVPEDLVFACPLLNGKFVAACAPYDPALTQGYSSIIYRYGTPGHIELTLPEDPKQFRRITFVEEETSYGVGEDDHYLRFNNGRVNYVLYSTYAQNIASFNDRGLAVFRDGRPLSKVSCQPDLANSAQLGLNFNNLLSIGVQSEQDTAHTLPFWNGILPENSRVRRRLFPHKAKH